MSDQVYCKWVAHAGLNSAPVVERLIDDDSGINVWLRLRGVSRLLRVRFESVVAYRNINESYRLSTWSAMDGHGWGGNCITVENSRWIDWLREEAGGVLDSVALMHYCIFTDEDCIDVVTEFEPDVQWVDGLGSRDSSQESG